MFKGLTKYRPGYISELMEKRKEENDSKSIPSKPKPSKHTPSKPTPSKPTPSKPTPSKSTPSKPTPSKPTPSKQTPSKPTPSTPSKRNTGKRLRFEKVIYSPGAMKSNEKGRGAPFKKYICVFCGKLLRSKRSWLRHISCQVCQKVKKAKKYECPGCQKVLSRSGYKNHKEKDVCKTKTRTSIN